MDIELTQRGEALFDYMIANMLLMQATARAKYLQRQALVRESVFEAHASAKAAREQLAESRRQDACEVKELLSKEKARKRQMERAAHSARARQRDDIVTWRELNTVTAGYAPLRDTTGPVGEGFDARRRERAEWHSEPFRV